MDHSHQDPFCTRWFYKILREQNIIAESGQNAGRKISRTYSSCVTEALCPLISNFPFPAPISHADFYITYPRPLFRKALAKRAISSPAGTNKLLSTLESEESALVYQYSSPRWVHGTYLITSTVGLSNSWECHSVILPVKRLILIYKKAKNLHCGLIIKELMVMWAGSKFMWARIKKKKNSFWSYSALIRIFHNLSLGKISFTKLWTILEC